jgi:hypothetical protein
LKRATSTQDRKQYNDSSLMTKIERNKAFRIKVIPNMLREGAIKK